MIRVLADLRSAVGVSAPLSAMESESRYTWIQQILDGCVQHEEELRASRSDQIDRILTTGGTSLIPAVREMLTKRYGPDKLHKRETFTSVAAGLAIVAQHT